MSPDKCRECETPIGRVLETVGPGRRGRKLRVPMPVWLNESGLHAFKLANLMAREGL